MKEKKNVSIDKSYTDKNSRSTSCLATLSCDLYQVQEQIE